MNAPMVRRTPALHRALAAVEAGSVAWLAGGPPKGTFAALERAGLIQLPGLGGWVEITELGEQVLAGWDRRWPPDHWLDWALVERYLLPRARRLELAALRGGPPERRLSALERAVVARLLWDRGAVPNEITSRVSVQPADLARLLEGWPGVRPLPGWGAA